MLLLHLVFAFIDGSAPTTVVNQTSEPYVRFDGIGGLSGVSAFWTRVNAALFTVTNVLGSFPSPRLSAAGI